MHVRHLVMGAAAVACIVVGSVVTSAEDDTRRSSAGAGLRLPEPKLKNPFTSTGRAGTTPQQAITNLPEPLLKNPFAGAPTTRGPSPSPVMHTTWRVTITVTVEKPLPEPRLKNPFRP